VDNVVGGIEKTKKRVKTYEKIGERLANKKEERFLFFLLGRGER